MALESAPKTGGRPGTATLEALKTYSPPAEACTKTPFTVGRRADGSVQSLSDAAQAAGMPFWDYIDFIFPGCEKDPRRVNWFLRYRYNCPETRDGKNRRFVGGEVLPLPKLRSDWRDAKPGIIPPIDPRHDSPDGRYDRARAAAFAMRHAYEPHKSFPPMVPADCTAFASQCLLAGGWPMVIGPTSLNWFSPGVWWYYHDLAPEPDPVEHAFRFWRKTMSEAVGSGAGPAQQNPPRVASWSWGGVPNLNLFLRISGRASVVPDWRALEPGDIIQLAHKSDDHLFHTMFVVERTETDLKLAQHTESKIQWLRADRVMERNSGDYMVCLKLSDRLPRWS